MLECQWQTWLLTLFQSGRVAGTDYSWVMSFHMRTHILIFVVGVVEAAGQHGREENCLFLVSPQSLEYLDHPRHGSASVCLGSSCLLQLGFNASCGPVSPLPRPVDLECSVLQRLLPPSRPREHRHQPTLREIFVLQDSHCRHLFFLLHHDSQHPYDSTHW